jgi:hypothetical protein
LLSASMTTARARAPEAEASKVLALVLADQARVHGADKGGRPCVRREAAGVALDDYAQFGVARGQFPQLTAYSATRKDGWTVGSPLPEAEDRFFRKAARALAAAPPAPVQNGPLAAAGLPLTLSWCRDERQLPQLFISAPAISGDAAFVDVGLQCAGLCGFGLSYALRRKPGGWRIVGAGVSWVS